MVLLVFLDNTLQLMILKAVALAPGIWDALSVAWRAGRRQADMSYPSLLNSQPPTSFGHRILLSDEEFQSGKYAQF